MDRLNVYPFLLATSSNFIFYFINLIMVGKVGFEPPKYQPIQLNWLFSVILVILLFALTHFILLTYWPGEKEREFKLKS